MPLLINGLRVEVVGREITGRPVPGRPRRSYWPYLRGLPSLALASVLIIPIAVTTVGAFRTKHGVGLGNFGVLTNAGAGRALLHSLIWVAVAVALIAAGFGIAMLGHRVSGLWRILQPTLVVPFAISGLVAGAAFRIIFDPAPERGTVTAVVTAVFHSSPVWLSPGFIWVVLVSAFCWGWLGYVVSLFRAGLEAIPDDLARAVKVDGLRGWRRLRVVELPILLPIFGIIGLTLVVAAVRLFDLILITAPGAMQADADVLALHWWRTTNAGEDSGRSAALALVLFAVVAVLAVLGMRGLRRHWAMPESAIPPSAQPSRPLPSRNRKVLGLAVGVPVSVFCAFPVLVLLLTALHEPAAAGLHGWWSSHGLGLSSFGAAVNAGLLRALVSNLLIAVVATMLVLAVAVRTAFLLAWGGLPQRLTRTVVIACVVLAVTPVQMYAAPLREAFAYSGLAGLRISLVLVHAAAGLPFAILLLRVAFASAPASLVAEALQGQARRSAVITRVRQTCGPALTAVAVLQFVLAWNDFTVGFLIGGPGATPLSLVLWGEARQFATSAGTVAAAAVVSSIVPVVLLLAYWPTVVRGLTVGTRP